MVTELHLIPFLTPLSWPHTSSHAILLFCQLFWFSRKTSGTRTGGSVACAQRSRLCVMQAWAQMDMMDHIFHTLDTDLLNPEETFNS